MNLSIKITDYEKKYKEALERAKDMLAYKEVRKEDMEYLFPELKESEDERIRNGLIKAVSGILKGNTLYGTDVTREEALAWLEKQEQEPKKVSIWKHWKNGIAGNGEGRQVYLIKTGNTYDLSSCLGFECDYIELSELDDLMLEKQDKHLKNYDEAEKEKTDFVSGQFIECRKSFNEFKEDNSYWFEYVGDDIYIGRSDNILNQKFHITPRQLYRLFSQQHSPKEDSNVNDEANAPTEYGKYVDECLNEASKHFFSNGEDKYSVADLFYAGVRCGRLENQGTPKDIDMSDLKAGTWIVHNTLGTCKIVCLNVTIFGSGYEVISCNDGIKHFIDFDHLSDCHLWTIHDAKNGDVLVNGSNIFIFHYIHGSCVMGYCHINTDTGRFYDDIGRNECFGFIDAQVTPATKEQRNLLFQKMKEDGYEWDAEKVDQNFKVKYAGSEYNVLEIKKIYSVIYYGIEDEPNHIDYIKADNCEIINGGYGVKEDGFSFPTKPVMFSEKK